MPLIKLAALPFTSLPSHPSLPTEPSRPPPAHIIRTALHEAQQFLTAIPSTFTADPKLRSSPPSAAKVKLLHRWRAVPPQESGEISKEKTEFWVCRQSEHLDSSSENGTASWSEFQTGLRTHHAEHEMEYTPSVTGVERLLEWGEEELGEAKGEIEVDGVRFKDVEMQVNLITHTFHPTALIAPRAFIPLAISAAYANDSTSDNQHSQANHTPNGFITLQIPFFCKFSSTPPEIHEKIMNTVSRRAIFAHYASVEQVTLLSAQPSTLAAPSAEVSGPEPVSASGSAQVAPTESATAPRRIQWTMATTSDACGSIPQWVQRNWTLGGVPRAVVADVGLFLGWIERRRSRRT